MFQSKISFPQISFVVLLLACASGLGAQSVDLPPEDLPLGTVQLGVPLSRDVFGFGDFPLSGSFGGIEYSISFSASGNLPPGLSLKSNGTLSGTPTAPGTFAFTINITEHITISGQPGQPDQSIDYRIPFNATLMVVAGSGPPVAVDSKGVNLTLTQSATTPVTDSISISNRGSAVKTYSATVTTNDMGSWLSVTPAAGSIAPFTSATLLVTANPAGLAPGTYTGKISIAIAPTGEKFDIPVVATVASSQQSLQLTQTGLRFQAVTGGAAPPPQTISVFNSGAGSLDFSTSASTVIGGPWLSVNPSSGRATSTSSATLTLSANPAGLSPGDYYGTIQVTAPDAANSPQTITVVLSVFSPANSPGALVNPTGLIFVGSAGGSVPPKSFTISNPSPQPLTFSTTATYELGNNWLTLQPPSGTVTNTTTVNVQPNLAGLAPNVYRADVVVRFMDNSVRHIAVLLLVLPAGITPGSGSPLKDDRAATCAPTRLLPLFTKLPAGFKTPVAWPTPIEATVIDDCGSPLVSGSVSASFSSGDPTLPLTSSRDGRWNGTWQPRNNAPQVTVTVKAQQSAPPLSGTESIGGALQANPTVPSIAAGGAVSAASYLGQQPLAPGGYIAIFGSHLSAGLTQSPQLPLETTLGGTQAILAGRQLPLQFASDGQINAIVPYDVPINTTLQLMVRQGGAVSVPEPVTVAAAQPAVFTSDLSGKGAGIITRPDGTFIDVGQPVTAGDTIVIYCSGLGNVDPPVPAGSAAPLTVLSRTVNPVSVTIAGQPANVQFAGLAPGFSGLYQINATVPAGVPAGDATLVITVAGQQSAPVTIAVK